MTDSESAKNPSTIGTMIEVLRCFTVNEPVRGVTDIAAQVGLHKSSVSRILQTLQQERLVVQDEQSRKYELSWGLLGIAGPLLSQLSVRRVAYPLMEDLRDSTQETVSLVVFDGLEGISVEQVASPRHIKHTSPMGTRYSTGHSASIQVFLAHVEEERVRELLAEGRFEFTTAPSAEDYLAALRQARADGFAANAGLTHPDEVGIAAPVFDHRGIVTAALMIAAPRYRTDDALIAQLGPACADVASVISERMGFAGHVED